MNVISGSVNSWLVSLTISMRVGVGQQTQRRRQVRLAVTADARGVDERQSVLQQRAGRGDLDAQHLAAAGLQVPDAGRS